MLLLRYVTYDARRYARVSASCNTNHSVAQEDAEIMRICHSIEKGLSLAEPRPGFGQDVITQLCGLLKKRMKENNEWTQVCADAVDALVGYEAFNANIGQSIAPQISETIEMAARSGHSRIADPNIKLTRATIEMATSFDAESFFWSRHSIRQFSPDPIDPERLIEAVDLARSTPSVCNRQSGRVRLVWNKGDNLGFLKYQNGNRGFGSSAQAILIVTSDLKCFLDASERYQPWIDGGMFSMNLVLALHAKGLGTCCLNWSQTDSNDIAMRDALGLPDGETIVMLIAVGKIPEELPVARSHRAEIEHVLTILDR